MLHFITGGSGSGKSEYIYKLFCDLCAAGEDRLLMLVPDQSSFDTEKNFLERLGAKNSRKIKVFGFSRLCDFVLEQGGRAIPALLEETDRALIMSIALDEAADSLVLYGQKKSAEDFITPLLDAVDEYENCGISPQQLRSAAARTKDPSLKQKLKDTALVYETYNAVLENKYTEPIKRLGIVKDFITERNPFEGYIIAVDSFSNFTAVELEILSTLMRGAAEMYFTLTTENYTEDKNGLFFTTNRTYRLLERKANDNGVKIAPNITLIQNRRTTVEPLAALEKNIFRTETERFTQETDAIRLYRADTVYEECDFAASEIKRLIVEEGFFLNDFAILTRNTEDYGLILENALKKYGLRYFNDRRENVSDKPLMKLIFYIFDAVSSSAFEPESILQILKTSMLPASVCETADFENYLYCWSVTSRDIQKPFTRNPRGFAPEFTSEDRDRLNEIERLRGSVVNPLIKFRKCCADANAREITKALYLLLLELQTDKCLLKLSEEYRSLGKLKFAEEQTRLWDCLMHCFDKIVMIAGERPMSLKRYAKLLQLQLSRADIGFIPQGQDLITLGSVERIRLHGKKVIFILGAVEGKFPLTPEASGIFSDNERRRLINLGLDLNYSCEDLIKQEKFLAYTALTAASDRLYISWYVQNLAGEAFSPSCIVSQLYKIFPALKTETLPVRLDCERMLYSEKAAFALCAERFQSRDALSEQLQEYFAEKEEFSHKLKAMKRALKKKQTDLSEKSTAKQLFGENLRVSASQIEKYYGCRFSYLCNYGFKIKERRKYTIDALEYGSFMHYILQRFFSENKKESFSSLSREEISLKTSEYIKDYVAGNLGCAEDKGKRFAYLLGRIRDAAAKLIKHIADEIAQSKFTPAFFEYKIGPGAPLQYMLTLGGGETVSISGSIDRVDLMDAEPYDNSGKPARYVRIIDYKTGGKQFNLYDILYGLNMQMLLYLSAVCQSGELTPAGILYMPAVSPIINSEDGDRGSIEKKLSKEYTMNGLLLDSTETLIGMEEKLEGKYIPVTAKNRGKTGCLISEKQFKQIFAYLDTKISLMAEEIYSGKFSPLPSKGGADSCAWCPYGDVCCFTDGQEQQNVFAVDNGEVFKIIENACGSEAEQNGKKLDE